MKTFFPAYVSKLFPKLLFINIRYVDNPTVVSLKQKERGTQKLQALFTSVKKC